MESKGIPEDFADLIAKKESLVSKAKTDTPDLTTKVIGDFGRWQFRIGFLMALLKLPIAWYQLNIMFMAPPQDFWCTKPKFLTGFSENEWRKISYPVGLQSLFLYHTNIINV